MDTSFLNGKVLTITGGTGSFGTTLLNFLYKTDIKKIKIISRDETKQDSLRKQFSDSKVEFFIGDIRDKDSLYSSLEGSDYVFHAAALKYVPSCEFFPYEAVKTNIIGSNNVLEAARLLDIKKVIMLSTDKAVMPINAMGISKSMMEKLTCTYGFNHKHSVKTIYNITRYGNVMGSRGSVIPLFIDLLLNGKDLTVTDLRMTRFMMSLEESVNLVLFALKEGNQGELFVQKAPSATIECLIKALEIIFKKKANLKTIGFRHSEKMHETLLSAEEANRSSEKEDYYIVKPDLRDLDYQNKENIISQNIVEPFESSNTKILEVEELVDLLLKQTFMKNYLNR